MKTRKALYIRPRLFTIYIRGKMLCLTVYACVCMWFCWSSANVDARRREMKMEKRLQSSSARSATAPEAALSGTIPQPSSPCSGDCRKCQRGEMLGVKWFKMNPEKEEEEEVVPSSHTEANHRIASKSWTYLVLKLQDQSNLCWRFICYALCVDTLLWSRNYTHACVCVCVCSTSFASLHFCVCMRVF